MLCMTTFSEHETAFINAIAFHIERDWKGQKGIFADKAGITGGYLSQIIGRKKCPQLDKQEKIAKTLGYKNVFEFVEFGKTLTVMPKFTMKADTPPPPAPVINLQDEADKKHAAVIAGFKDKDMAVELNEILVEIEKLEGTTGLIDAKKQLNYVLMAAREKKGLAPLQQNLKNGTSNQQ
ncbi:MAG: helix-turn-helix transcriptional regulator [Desulfamplus sp.]|nr:helix-turn-helix transcriptional regulator [Desulfamplus sp.]